MTATNPLMSILLDSALKQYSHNKKHHPEKLTKNASPEDRHAGIKTYTNPDNWTATQVITLVHKSPPVEDAYHLTLIGNFQEFIHKNGARKLCRIEQPTVAQGVEYVTGNWWIAPEQEKAREEAKGHWVKQKELTIGVTLKELLMHAPTVKVCVTTYFDSISKVELCEETRFFDDQHDHHLMLHRGTDILACMSLDSKLDLRAQLNESLSQSN